MADQFSPELQNFKEHEVQAVVEKMGELRANPESKNWSDQEIIKKSLQSITPANPISDGSDEQGVLPSYMSSASAEAKLEVEHLLTVAMQDGIEKATTEAVKSSPFILDAFHDALAGRLYPELKRRGVLE